MRPSTSSADLSVDPSAARAEAEESSLRARLGEVATDRAASAREIVLETARAFRDWVLECPEESARDGARIEAALADWSEEQVWRGPCALWLDSLRRAFALASQGDADRGPAGLLAAEMEAWIQDASEEEANPGGRTRDPEGEVAWKGEPLAPGRRLPRRTALARRAVEEIARGETVLLTSWSETLILSLEAAWRAERRPSVVIGEGLPHLDGRRMARRLSRSGIPVTMVYDSALLALLPRVDRVWLATEAIGAGAFLARVGTGALLEECARREIPVRVLATSDKLVPGGVLRLPAWCARQGWLLWEEAPEGVRLETQTHEAVPHDLVDGFLTEAGSESAATLHLRALRVEVSPACGGRPARLTTTSST